MPVIQGRTREQIRQDVGHALGAIYVSSASSNGTTGTLIDNTLAIGGDDTFNGKWIRFTSGDDDGAIRRVTDYTASSYTMTLLPALSASSTSGDTYEMWMKSILLHVSTTLSTKQSRTRQAMPMTP